MTRALELIDVLIVVGAAWALTVAGIAVVALVGDVADWLKARSEHRRSRYVAELEAELGEVLDELVEARRRITVLEARCARLAVDAVWPGDR